VLVLALTAVPPAAHSAAPNLPQKRQIVALASLAPALTQKKPARSNLGTGQWNRPHQSRSKRLFRHEDTLAPPMLPAAPSRANRPSPPPDL